MKKIQAIVAGPCGANSTAAMFFQSPLAVQTPVHPVDLSSSVTCSGKLSLVSQPRLNPALQAHRTMDFP